MNSVIPFVFLIVTISLTRISDENAMKKLDPEKKAELITLFSTYRIWSLSFIVLSLLVTWLLFWMYRP